MQVYTFWARATQHHPATNGQTAGTVANGQADLVAYAGSDISLADAQARAAELLQRRHAWLEAEKSWPQEYPVGSRPLREQLQQRVMNSQGELIAAITRNHYGSRVLNSAQVMFIDVDDQDLIRPLPDPTPFSLIGFFKRLFNPPPPAPPLVPREQLDLRLAAWLQLYPSWNFRVYRTRLGFRLFVTHLLLTPASPEAQEVFAAMRADSTYVRLCLAQGCYRARLEPKPWRVRFHRPPHRFPYDTPEQARQHLDWEQQYTAHSHGYSVCEWVGEYGSGQTCAEAKQLADLHDTICVGTNQLA
ncbi:hypothetical protein IC235_21395 [Hymenobacter sp. BT664]|uniref:Uncharacterized protein n=1 Tax=Hymenobacter montanus TaxID=2771359 RepID=A0A927BI35_9BACT|nr:hypothetical protein [Hymenobacter montanus]MBD2770448.1 hypothetical protein [Hymenobacter montanus]